MRFHRVAFQRLRTQLARAARAAELAEELAQRLERASDFHSEIEQIVQKLRELGHELWSWDESDDFEIWGPDYQNRSELVGLLIDFRRPADVEIEWLDRRDPTIPRQVFGEGFH